MRYLSTISLLSFAIAVAGTNPEDGVGTAIEGRGDTDISEAAAEGEETTTSTVASSTDSYLPDLEAPSDLTIVAMDPLLGEFMTELILNIEKAIDNYAFEMAMAEATMEADTSADSSFDPHAQQDSASSTVIPTSQGDDPAPSTTPVTESPSSSAGDSPSTAPVAV